jgi:hypothetical protein
MYRRLAIASLALMLASQAKAESAPRACQMDREKIVRLTFWEFDQDASRGWRKIASRPGCERAAAELIRHYREKTGSKITTLYWHEGQLRANLGENRRAVQMFRKSLKNDDILGWNYYALSTIAFVKRDRKALIENYEKLKVLPVPQGQTWIGDDGKKSDRPPEWPPNLHVVEAMVKCFGQTYRQVYSKGCP